MQSPHDGGPAFPTAEYPTPRSDEPVFTGGMSLRDYLAAKAMQSFCSMCGSEGEPYMPSHRDEDFAPAESSEGYRWYRSTKGFWAHLSDTPGDHSPYDPKPYDLVTSYEARLARDAYEQADAMIAERNRREGGAH